MSDAVILYDGRGIPISRSEIMESLYELRDMGYKWEKHEDPTFVRCPDLELVLKHIEIHGLPPK